VAVVDGPIGRDWHGPKVRRGSGLVVTKYRGLYVLRKATGRQRTRPTPLRQAWINKFRCVARWSKTPDHFARAQAEEQAKGTGWFWRDVLSAAAAGVLIRYQDAIRVTTPTARVSRVAVLAVTHDRDQAVVPDTVEWDNNFFHDPDTNPSRLTCRSAGLYAIGAYFYWPQFQTNARWNQIRKNGTEALAFDANRPGANWDVQSTLCTIAYFDANDYVEAVVNCQNTNANLYLRNFWILAVTPESLT